MSGDLAGLISDCWLKMVRQPRPVKNDGHHCCQGVVTVSMMAPVLSVMEKPRVQNRLNPRMLTLW